MKDLYEISGISKQSFHQMMDRRYNRLEEQMQLLPIIQQLREDHPKMSSRMFYLKLNPKTMGRDLFEAFCFEHGFKVDVKARSYRTTNSKGVNRFPNLLLEKDELGDTNQIWVSDITYYDLKDQVVYITFIQDLYNREIIGYTLSQHLNTEYTTYPSLQQSIRNKKPQKGSGLIFHSDGGGQYFSKVFLSLTKANGIRNSMGKTAYENPHAERINGTIKNQYLYPWNPKSYKDLDQMLTKAVYLYNTERPHQSLGGHTPAMFKLLRDKGLLTKVWVINKKKKVTKKEKVNINIT
jgi:putative transposase